MVNGAMKQDAANLLKIIVNSPKGISFRDLLNQSGLTPDEMKRGLSFLYDPKFILYEVPQGGTYKVYTATPEGINCCQKGCVIPDRQPSQGNYTPQGDKMYLWIGKDESWDKNDALSYPSSTFKNLILHLETLWAMLQQLMSDVDGVMSGELEAYLIQGPFGGKEQDGRIHVQKPIKIERVTDIIKGISAGTNSFRVGQANTSNSGEALAQALETASDNFDSLFGGADDLPWGDIDKTGEGVILGTDDNGDLPF